MLSDVGRICMNKTGLLPRAPLQTSLRPPAHEETDNNVASDAKLTTYKENASLDTPSAVFKSDLVHKRPYGSILVSELLNIF